MCAACFRPARAVTLPNIRVPHYIGVSHGVTYRCGREPGSGESGSEEDDESGGEEQREEEEEEESSDGALVSSPPHNLIPAIMG